MCHQQPGTSFTDDIDRRCVFCNNDNETVIYFLNAYVLNYFWLDIDYLFKALTGSMVELEKKRFYCDKEFDCKRLFILNLYRKYYIHKCKWAKKKPHIQQFKIENRHYIETLNGLKNCKALKTLEMCKAPGIFPENVI